MSKKTLCILTLLISLSLLSAQTEQDSTKIFKTHSIQFRVQDCFSLSSFKGSLISYKYHFNDRNALRIGFSNNIEIGDEEKDYDVFLEDTTYYEEQISNSDINLVVTMEYLRYLNPTKEIIIYIGGGTKTSVHKHTEKVDEKSHTEQFYDKSRKYSIIKAGLSFSYGLEWKFRKNMSLHAEYGNDILWFHYKSRKYRTRTLPEEGEQYSIHKEVEKGIELNSTGVLLGLSIYF